MQLNVCICVPACAFTWRRACQRIHASCCPSVCSNTRSDTLLSRCQCLHVGVFVYSTYTNVTKGKGGGLFFFFLTFPWKCCELYDALNLFSRSCQANEVSEWGRPGGGRGQPRASSACQAAVLWGCNPQPDCSSGHSTAPWQCLAHTAPICHTKADLH